MFKLPKIKIAKYEFAAVFGSRKVIKDPDNPAQQHFYATAGDDLWTAYGKSIADMIPEGMIVYGELIGWTKEGAPLQKGYTYDLPHGMHQLFVYRVATVNAQGVLSDLSWDGVKEFCVARGLATVPELTRTTVPMLNELLTTVIDVNLFHVAAEYPFTEDPLPLSDLKTVDEGVCFRQEGLVPRILKAKSPVFLEHETKMLDKGEADLETVGAF